MRLLTSIAQLRYNVLVRSVVALSDVKLGVKRALQLQTEQLQRSVAVAARMPVPQWRR